MDTPFASTAKICRLIDATKNAPPSRRTRMARFDGGDESSPWNCGIEQDDPRAPWNNPMYNGDPRYEWNSNGGMSFCHVPYRIEEE